MTLREFHNGLRLLMGLDFSEVQHAITAEQWPSFRDDPHTFFIRADDPTTDKIWAVMKGRMK